MPQQLLSYLGDHIIYAAFFSVVGIAVMAHSPNRFLRAAGLYALLLIALSFFGAAALLVHKAVAGPRFNEGIGNFASLVFAFPLGLFGWWAFKFYQFSKQYQAGESPYCLTFDKFRQILKAFYSRKL